MFDGLTVNVLVTRLNRYYSYDECRKFDLIASCTTGTDHIDNKDVPLISLRGEVDFLSDVWATAEHTWALLLALARKIPWAYNDVSEGYWRRELWQGAELRGKVLGIVGYGRVGRQVAKIADGFGMDVIFHDNRKRGYTLTDVLVDSDVVTVHVPLTDETIGMFGREQFELMKPTAYFINTSRGAVVKTHELLAALGNNIIAGAALDVLDGEPDIDADILDYLGRDNLIITPHIGGNTVESRIKTQMFIARKVLDYAGGDG